MADQIPKWARVPKKDGWCIQVTDEDGQQRRIPANGRAGFLLGRNGQVDNSEDFKQSHNIQVSQATFQVEADRGVNGLTPQVCDVEIVHKSASRVHACIAFDDEGCAHIVDLGSTHGKFLRLLPWSCNKAPLQREDFSLGATDV